MKTTKNKGGVFVPLRSFKRGDIIWWSFPPSPIQPDFTIRGRHMAVILSDDSLKNRTVVISPISSVARKNKESKPMKNFHLPLLHSVYPHFLTRDSYIKLDQLNTITRDAIPGRIIGSLTPEDLLEVDMKLLRVLELYKAVETLLNRYLQNLPQSPNTR